jgi:hypothetical protein
VLSGLVRPGLLRRCLKEAKAEAARRERAAVEERRTSLEVLARDALWSMDALHIGRSAEDVVEALVLRDVASSCTLALRIGPPATVVDVVALLEHARRARGTLPLVLAMDNWTTPPPPADVSCSPSRTRSRAP